MDNLMKMALPIVDFEKCKTEHEDNFLDDEKQICAGGVRGKVKVFLMFICL